jgi:dipeptidyl aminopeptidase/acylaminoacyl peptidase
MVDFDGSNLTRLTSHPGDDYRPTWSPDAANIAFASNRAAGNYDIYVMGDDGSGVRRLTTLASIQGEPAWSPQELNRMLISTYQRSSGGASTPAIAEIDTRTGNVTTYWTNPGSLTLDIYPDWKPTGNGMTWMRVDCSAASCHDIDVWVSNFEDFRSGIADSPTDIEEYPAWAPDATRIYYDTNLQDPDRADDNVIFDIFSVEPIGSNAQAVTANTSSFAFDVDVQPIPPFPLVDARFSSFEQQIEWIYGEAITSGCNAERYCPSQAVTRGQMAAFLARALDLPAATLDYFTDDESSTFEDSINRVREAEIAFGCTETTYCPSNPVTRGQMAAFLYRALAP